MKRTMMMMTRKDRIEGEREEREEEDCEQGGEREEGVERYKKVKNEK